MALTLRRVDGAEVRPLTPSEERVYIRRRDRGQHDFHTVKLPRARRLTVLPTQWLLPGDVVRDSLTAPHRLELSTDAGRSYWVIGHAVYWLNDLDVTAEDVHALHVVLTKRREDQLKRARAVAAAE